MMSNTLFNLQPVLHLLLTALVLAVVPLSWIWLRHAHTSVSQRIHLLTLLTLFLTFDLVLFGSFTRLTDSGLGCPDWPGCYGFASPLGAHSDIAQAQTEMPTGPVTHTKAWIEMVHRYLAMTVGGLILTLAVFAWVRRFKGDKQSQVLWPSVTLLWVCVQGAFGALTVTMKLFPLIVSLHLMGGITLLGLLFVQSKQSHPRLMPPAARIKVVVGLALLVIQIFLGAWVSTNYAVLACDTFPLCQNTLWPQMDFAQAFAVWRPLGITADGQVLSFQALTAIHMLHRMFAMLVFVYLTYLALQVCKPTQPLQTSARRYGRWLAALLLLQVVTGVSNVVLGWPLFAAVLHTGGAAALCVVLIGLLL
jgi:cytochrome c oxidase assembly protein subunit 15